MGHTHSLFRRCGGRKNRLAHRPEDGNLILDGFVNGDRLRGSGRELEQLIDNKLFDRQPMCQRPCRNRLQRQSLQVTLKSRVLSL